MTSKSVRICVGATVGLALATVATLALPRDAQADKIKIKGTIVVSSGPVITTSTGDEAGTSKGIAYVPPGSDNPPPQIRLNFDCFGGGDATGAPPVRATLSASGRLTRGEITRWEVVRTGRSLRLYLNGKAVQEEEWPVELADAPLTIYARTDPFDGDRFDYGNDFVITLNATQGSATNTYRLSAPVIHF